MYLAGLLAGLFMLSACAGPSVTDPTGTTPATTGNSTQSTESAKGEEGPVDIVNNNGQPFAVNFTDVVVKDEFWSARQKQFICVTVMAGIKNVEAAGGGVSNIINAAKKNSGKSHGQHEGALYADSDVHKMIEAMCYALQFDADGDEEVLAAQTVIRNKIDEWIPYYQGAQEADGYFDTYFTLAHPTEKWTDFNLHELYCMGHFYEAAVAHYRMTGGSDSRLFDIAIKNADYVESLFGPGKWKQVPGHQEIELALLKLANLCRELGTKDGVDYAAKAEKYVALAQFFLDTRGDQEDRHGFIDLPPSYIQDELPITEQTTALSHAVRAHYMYTAMADAMIQNGSDIYNNVLLALWDSVNTKTYVTGGVGVSDHHEGYGPDYYMPLDKAYCETCASISNVMWNQRMNLLFGDAKYADKMETAIYNAMLSGIDLNGDRFFYTNVVTSAGRERVEWYGTACCPPNLMRTVLAMGGYIYTQKGDEVRMNLYIGNEANITLSDGAVKLDVYSDMPWDSNVTVTVTADGDRDMALRLRLPEWATGENKVFINGESYSAKADADGYITLNRTWRSGDTVDLYFPMEVQSIEMVEGIEELESYTAFRRGPIVYAAEGVDNDAELKLYYVQANAQFDTLWVENLDGKADPYGLRGVMKIVTDDATAHLPSGDSAAKLTLVPYYATANRGVTALETYISLNATEQPLEYYAKPTACYINTSNGIDSVKSLNDGLETPTSRWTSYGGPKNPWVEYTFDTEVTVRGCQILWMDDGGGVQVPGGLTIEYWDGEKYVPVTSALPFGYFPKNSYGNYVFDEVKTTRIRMTIKNGPSGADIGIYEWKLLGEL